MGAFFVYILKSSVCLALFYLFYRLLLSRETFHRFNRIAVLGILLLSTLLPFCSIAIERHTEVQQAVLSLEHFLLLADEGEPLAELAQPNVGWIQIVLAIYLAGILFFAGRNLYSLVRLLILLRTGRREKLGKSNVLVTHTRENLSPFSWLKYVVVSEKDLEENGREILIHELAHIRNRHSCDLFVADICIFLQWFNPAAWLLKQEIQNIHEYEADETVIKEGIDAKQYQLLIIKKAVGTRLYSMANSFNHSKLKKRITMMLKEKSSPWARLKYLYVLPVAAIAVTAFARPEISSELEEISAVKVNDLTAILEENTAENVSDRDSLILAKEITNTNPASNKASEVVVEYTAVRSNQEPVVKKTKKESKQIIVEDKELAGEIIAVNPDLAEFQIRFTGEPQLSRKVWDSSDAPLIFIDGIEVSKSILSAISTDRIESISVLKDNSATKLYGDKGKNGVILITLKKPADNNIVVVHPDNQVTDKTSIRVEGYVRGPDKKPVAGAAVVITGTANGTITDVDGRFIIEASEDATLEISYIGLNKTRVKVKPKVTVDLKKD